MLDQILAVKNLPLGEARSLLGRYLFSGDDVFKRIGDLSGGERARVALAMLALQGANFLLLDEPTTHLDLDAQEALQQVLAEFEGSVIFVTHDRYLVNVLATQVWEIRDGRLWTYRGTYADYLAEREKEKTRDAKQGAGPGEKRRGRQPVERHRLRPKKRDLERLSTLEERISELEGRLEALTSELSEASQAMATERVQRLSREYEGTQGELEECVEEWTSLSAGIAEKDG